MNRGIVISLYDYTGEACRPWAEAGHVCFAFDIQHDDTKVDLFDSGGSINYVHADLHKADTLRNLMAWGKGVDVVFGMAFPVCTDLAVSGAAHFRRKAEKDPYFQERATTYAIWCSYLFDVLHVPYYVENPVSRLSTLWRKPDYSFHPFEYGGYIPEEEAEHPKWPEFIPNRDAYKKKTCLWTGGGFVMPEKEEVDCSAYYGNGYSKPMMKLGGKSKRTKDIRSATPRGFAKAVYEANRSKE